MSIEHRLDETSLHTSASAVDQPDLAEPGVMGGPQVLVDDRSDVGWCERMQVQRSLDRHAHGFGLVVDHGFW